MCTYATEQRAMEGSAKGPGGTWFPITGATVYFDHPVHAMALHTVNVDIADPARGPAARVALELTVDSARALVDAIEGALASVPAGVLEGGAVAGGASTDGGPGA